MNTVYILKQRLEKVNRLLLIAISNKYYEKVGQAKYLIQIINKEIERLTIFNPPHLQK